MFEHISSRMSLHTSVCMCLYISYTFLVVCSLKPANGLPVSTNGSPASLLNRPMETVFPVHSWDELPRAYPSALPQHIPDLVLLARRLPLPQCSRGSSEV